MRLELPGIAAVALVAMSAGTAHAQSISPTSVSATLNVGESITIHKTITLAPGGADFVDLFFLTDATGSMSEEIAAAKAGALSVISGVGGSNFLYGAGHYYGDCSEADLVYCDQPNGTGYVLDADLGTAAAANAGINTWAIGGVGFGGDTPEAGFDALAKVSDGTSWRSGSQRLIVWFGDAPSHTGTTTYAGSVAALTGAGANVIAFNSAGAGAGLDGFADGEGNQASRLVADAGGSLTNNFDASTDFVSAVSAGISAATSSLDLVFGTDFFAIYSGGLAFAFTCTDALGCTNVGGGETRSFDVTITALEVGTYDFTIGADGVAAREADHIVVAGPGSVTPEPSTWVMLASGLLGLGVLAWKRKEEELA